MKTIDDFIETCCIPNSQFLSGRRIRLRRRRRQFQIPPQYPLPQYHNTFPPLYLCAVYVLSHLWPALYYFFVAAEGAVYFFRPRLFSDLPCSRIPEESGVAKSRYCFSRKNRK